MKKMSWTVWNAAACTLLCVGTAQAGTMVRVEAAQPAAEVQPAPAIYSPGDGQVKDDLLDGLEKLGANAKERNEVNLDKSMMALTAGRRGGRYADLSQKMDMITVRSYEFAAKDMYSRTDLNALRKRLDGNGWSHIVRNESERETSDIAVRATPDGYISDMVILNAESRELTIVHLRGHFHMEDVNGAMGATMGLSRGTGSGAMGVLGPLGSSNYSSSHATPATQPSQPVQPAQPAQSAQPGTPAPPAQPAR